MIFFSVIIATYNRKDLLKKAVQSVLLQDHENWELIIVNDCSSDGTKEYLDSIKSPKIKVIHNLKNLHKGGARNVGIENCTGEFVCFLDDDDYYLQNHLSTFSNYLKINKKFQGLLFTLCFHENQLTKERTKKILPEIMSNKVAYLFDSGNGIPTPLVCINKSILENEKFNQKIKIGQDTELFLRIVNDYDLHMISQYTVVQLTHSDNSGNIKYNHGKDRLNGYKFIFDNKKIARNIPRRLKNYMYSFCYRRMADYYNYHNYRMKTIQSAVMALYYDPISVHSKINIVYIFYNLPGLGTILSKLIKKIKNEEKH
jgi:glycosyltransferase involved in cell wall biosynthesis